MSIYLLLLFCGKVIQSFVLGGLFLSVISKAEGATSSYFKECLKFQRPIFPLRSTEGAFYCTNKAKYIVDDEM